MPMKYGLPEIPMKNGVIICGPPGTGKTSIGRWLANKIHGKIYSLTAGQISEFIETFKKLIVLAKNNKPSVIFIDDCDILFEYKEIYRSFLTTLDGIDSKSRSGICFLLTCMNLKTIPSSLIRGGRLEMVLVTKLPSTKKIIHILTHNFQKLSSILSTLDFEKHKTLLYTINQQFITSIAYKMNSWNYADINRFNDDLLRNIISDETPNIQKIIDKCIEQIRDQYLLCAKIETTDLDEIKNLSYYN